MCAIAGLLGVADDAAAAVRRMCLAMAHRGPDQDGLWTSQGDPRIVLGHQRLSIIDLSDAGRQPMVDERTGVALVFNGECYNFLELRAELEKHGRAFVSATDTEVVLAAYLQWGEQAMERLRGMFALAIWDPRDRSLVLARDRLGIKPLYYAQQAERLLFASELRALLASRLVEPLIDRRALSAFLWHGFVPGPRTIIEGIRLLEPGTVLRIGGADSVGQARRYWTYPRAVASPAAPEEAAAHARLELERAVAMHLVSDVPLGIFLSGGVDSSVVAAMAQKQASRPVTTFNVRFEEAAYDESPYARRVAQALGTDHREVTLTEHTFAEHLEDALGSIDQPTFDALNTYFVSRAVKEAGLTVALAGTGGDELFGGYSSFVDLPRLRRAAPAGLLPARLRRALTRLLAERLMGPASEIPHQTRWGKLSDALGTRGDLVGLYQVAYGLFTQELAETLAWAPAGDLRWGLYPEQSAALADRIRGESELAAISSLEVASFLGDRLLRDTDAASMAVSLEVRVPLLDHEVVEAAVALPDEARFQPLRKKAFLKSMVADQIDPAVFERDKAGFELPLAVWCGRLLATRLDETFHDVNLAQAAGLDPETVGRVWRAFKKRGAGVYWSRVWSLYVLMDWCRRQGAHV